MRRRSRRRSELSDTKWSHPAGFFLAKFARAVFVVWLRQRIVRSPDRHSGSRLSNGRRPHQVSVATPPRRYAFNDLSSPQRDGLLRLTIPQSVSWVRASPSPYRNRNSAINPGGSCPFEWAIGPKRPNRRVLVLVGLSRKTDNESVRYS